MWDVTPRRLAEPAGGEGGNGTAPRTRAGGPTTPEWSPGGGRCHRPHMLSLFCLFQDTGTMYARSPKLPWVSDAYRTPESPLLCDLTVEGQWRQAGLPSPSQDCTAGTRAQPGTIGL